MDWVLILLFCVSFITEVVGDAKYPITASWFKDRFTPKEWDGALEEFQSQGGDTVWLRAPQVVIRSKEDLQRDPSFVWCGSYKSSTGVLGKKCYDEAEEELSAKGLNVTTFLTFNYEENFSDALLMCPEYDRKIESSRIYYRIVLPLVKLDEGEPCKIPANTPVAVMFTSFAGTDPHELLVASAATRNMSVYFGLPAFPSQAGVGFATELAEAYYTWVYRMLMEQKQRYSQPISPLSTKSKLLPTYNTIVGYYSTDECCLGQVTSDSMFLDLYKRLGVIVHNFDKLFVISPYVNLNMAMVNLTKEQHVAGFELVAQVGVIDVIAVQEGRGAGKGCYYWDTERDLRVEDVDPVLDEVIHYINPTIRKGVTYREAFTSSNQEVFRAFSEVRDNMVKSGNRFEFWLNVEAFEYLRDDPCLPVDIQGSGMAELLDRTSKARIDRALTVAGAFTQKIISFAWDSDYTCVSNNYNESLAATIRQNIEQPIVSNCSFHSANNQSVVIIGYNLAGLMQTFEVDYPTRDGKREHCELYGYYFELDYGIENDRVSSLEYTQLFDVPDVYTNLAPKGYVKVQPKGSNNYCIFVYDYGTLSNNKT